MSEKNIDKLKNSYPDNNWRMHKKMLQDGEEVTIFPCSKGNHWHMNNNCDENNRWCYILFEDGEVFNIYEDDLRGIDFDNIKSKKELRNILIMERL